MQQQYCSVRGRRGEGVRHAAHQWVSVSTLRDSPATLAADSAVEQSVCLPDSSRCGGARLAAGWRTSAARLPVDCSGAKRACERVCGDEGRRVDVEVGGGEQPGEGGCW